MVRTIPLTWDGYKGILTFDRTTGDHLKRMETVTIQATMLSNGVADTSVAAATLTLKPVNTYGTVLASWTLTQVGSTNVLTGTQTLSSQAITDLLGTTLDYVNCVADADSNGLKTGTVAFVLENNVTRSTDGTPTATAADITNSGYTSTYGPFWLGRYTNSTGAIQKGTFGSGLSVDANGVLSATASGSGDVVGPASATDNAIALFNTTTGKLIQNSGITIPDNATVFNTANTPSPFPSELLNRTVQNLLSPGGTPLTPGSATQQLWTSLTTTTAVWNTSLWAANYNLTCVPFYNSHGYGPGCLITANHIVLAAHISTPTGTTVRFLGATGTVYTRTITAIESIALTDIQIGRLSSALPSDVTPASILPTDYVSSFGANIKAAYAGCLDSTASLNTLTYFALDSLYAGASTIATPDAQVLAFARPGASSGNGFATGDSGSPAFLLLEGNAILVGLAYTTNATSFLSYAVTAINAAITTLGGGGALTEFDSFQGNLPTQVGLNSIWMDGRFRYLFGIGDTLSADQNNYNPTGFSGSGFWKINCSGAPRTITGLMAGQNGETVWLYNSGSTINPNGLVLTHNDFASDFGNRFNLGASGHVVRLMPGEGMQFVYDTTVWRALKQGPMTSGNGDIIFTVSGDTSLTLPTSGTVATLAGSETLSNKTVLLGTEGSVVGTIGFRNATSGTTTLVPSSGALGTQDVTLPKGGRLAIEDGDLGTPTSVTLTNATGLPVSTGISGLGSGVATFLATPSSANLAAAVTGETGTAGGLVFSGSPTLTGTVTLQTSGRIFFDDGGLGTAYLQGNGPYANSIKATSDGATAYVPIVGSIMEARNSTGTVFCELDPTGLYFLNAGGSLLNIAAASISGGNKTQTFTNASGTIPLLESAQIWTASNNFSNTTAATSSITGAVRIGNGTAATNVGIGNGNVYAGTTVSAGTSVLVGTTKGWDGNQIYSSSGALFLGAPTGSNICIRNQADGAIIPFSVVIPSSAGSGATMTHGAVGTNSALALTRFTKTVASIADNTATAVLTVTIPNAAHAASLSVQLDARLGAGGAIGADEAFGTITYDIAICRTAGVNAVATMSSAYGSATSSVAGGATITVSAVVSAISGAVGASNTFTVNVTIARGSGSATNHRCNVIAELFNSNATGITIA